MSLPTARATLPGSVQGVVVQARIEVFGSFLSRNRTKMLGSGTLSRYPIASSWLESGVAHRGQYGATRKPLYTRPCFHISLRAHHTDWMYSEVSVQYAFS